jgi:hypothetical protein
MSDTLKYGDIISINIAGDGSGRAVAGDEAGIVLAAGSQAGQKKFKIVIWRYVGAEGTPVKFGDNVYLKTADETGYLSCDFSGNLSITNPERPEFTRTVIWVIATTDGRRSTDEIKIGETIFVLAAGAGGAVVSPSGEVRYGFYLSRKAVSDTNRSLTVDAAFEVETSRWVFTLPPLVGAAFINKMKLAAQQRITQALHAAAQAQFDAHQKANIQIEAAKREASAALNLHRVFIHYGKGQWALFDGIGTCLRPSVFNPAAGEVDNIAVDAAVQRIYFRQAGELISQGFDGSNRVVLSRAEGTVPTGTVEFEPNEGCVFWVNGSEIRRTDISTGATKLVIRFDLASVFSNYRIALDRSNRKIYWSNGHELISCDYDGSITSYTSDWMVGKLVAADGEAYGMTKYQVKRFHLGGFSEPLLPLNDALQHNPEKGPLYMSMALDLSRGSIYWSDQRSSGPNSAVLLRSPIERYLGGYGEEPRQATEVFRIEGIQNASPGPLNISDLVLVTLSNALAEANSNLHEATIQLNDARTAAPLMIAQAHQDAKSTINDAHAALEAAHKQANDDITAKTTEVTDRRQVEQQKADVKHTAADRKLSDAREYDTAKRADANTLADTIRKDKAAEAQSIMKPALDRLDEARRKQQNS